MNQRLFWLLPLTLALACDEATAPGSDLSAPPDLGAAVLRCSEDPLPLQNPRSFTLGETFYLPRVRGEAGCPAALTWEVLSAPSGSLAQPAAGAAGEDAGSWPRLTPDVAGDYVVQLHDVPGSRLLLTVVRRSNAERFRNHYLTPLYGLAPVGDELWAAGGAASSVIRLQAGADGTWRKRDEVPVGLWPAAVAWRDPMPYAVVANRGSDTIGFIDRQRGVQSDALWVGDEPTGLALHPDGKHLYVSLATMRQIAVVDLSRRVVAGRISVGFDPRALALSADGARLFVASYRSANLQAGPMGSRSADDDQDLWIIDTASATVKTTLHSISADLRALALSPDGAELYVADTDGDTIPSQADANARPFVHQVHVIGADPAQADRYGKVLRSADLTRQMGSAGPVVNPSGVLAVGDALFVSAEGSDSVLILDRATLAERSRVSVGGGPRQLVALPGGDVAVHCFLRFEVVILSAQGAIRQRVTLTEDPRPAALALGEQVFTRPGLAYAANHACASCHVEAQNDGMIWRFGPSEWANVRPLQLLDATTPMGWSGYVSNTANFGVQGPSSIIARPPTQAEMEGLAGFLGSLIGAPRATGWTRPDGSFSAAGERGRQRFAQKGCVACHVPGLYTNRTLVEKGKSGLPADVPSLLGVYRHGVYLQNGKARSLPEAIDVALSYLGASASDSEKADLLAFLRELTPKGAAPLALWPDRDSSAAVQPDVQPWAAFADLIDSSLPGKTAAQAAAPYVVLEDAAGQRVPGQVQVDAAPNGLPGSAVRFVPDKPLSPGQGYSLRVLPGLPFLGGGVLDNERGVRFTVAQPATGALPTNLRLTVTIPPLGPMGTPVAVPLDAELQPAPAGAGAQPLLLHLPGGLTQRLWVELSGDDIYLQGFGVPVGRGVADAGLVAGKIIPVTSSVQITSTQGTVRLGAPGINVPGVPFELAPR